MDGKNRRKPSRRSSSVTIRGLLVPDRWDEQGAVTGLALLTGDEEKYLIKPDDNLAPLLPVLRTTIELEGVLRVEKGQKLFFYHSTPSQVGG